MKPVQLRQPTGKKQSNVRKHQDKISIRPILFLYNEESLVSSHLNSKLFRFHCVRPNVQCTTVISIKANCPMRSRTAVHWFETGKLVLTSFEEEEKKTFEPSQYGHNIPILSKNFAIETNQNKLHVISLWWLCITFV